MMKNVTALFISQHYLTHHREYLMTTPPPTNSITYPLKKTLVVNGIKVEIVKLKEDGEVGAKIFSTQDADGDKVGMNVFNYLIKEDMLTEAFLFLDTHPQL